MHHGALPNEVGQLCLAGQVWTPVPQSASRHNIVSTIQYSFDSLVKNSAVNHVVWLEGVCGEILLRTWTILHQRGSVGRLIGTSCSPTS